MTRKFRRRAGAEARLEETEQQVCLKEAKVANQLSEMLLCSEIRNSWRKAEAEGESLKIRNLEQCRSQCSAASATL